MERKHAIALGLKRYNTGKPCKHGHVADRLVSTRTCITCLYGMRRAWITRNPERHRELDRACKARHKYGYDEKSKKRMREYYRRKKGIPEATHKCPANCECCGRRLGEGKQIHLDHCHVTGVFRGWLCNSCNLGLGMLGDSIAGVEKALTYLTRAYSITIKRFA
jgi:hypothetical protein